MPTGTIILSGLTVVENPDADTVVGALSVTGGADGETFAFTLVDNPGGRFDIVSNGNGGYDLIVKAGSQIDFEDNSLNSFGISISATSNAGSTPTHVNDGSFTISATNVNEAPTDLALVGGIIAEDTAVGSDVATLVGLDPDANDTLTYTLVADAQGNPLGTPNAFFEIVGNTIKLKAGLDQPQVGPQSLWVEVKDAAGLTFVKQVTLTVTDSLETVSGTSRNDWLSGTEFADLLTGGAGNDKIYGRGGDDIINGGLGKDFLSGGAGKDTFVFDTPVKKGHFDHVVDFNSADDTLQFNLAALKSFKVKVTKKGHDDSFNKGKPEKVSFGLDKVFKKGKLEKKFFTVGDKAKDSNDYVYYDKKKGFVYLDTDGSGHNKGIEILKVKPGTTITADDFLFI